MKRPEEALHMAVARFLDVALPSDAVWWHTPNGGKRTRAEAGKFKAMGVRAGFPDIAILWRGKLLVVELKAPGKSPARLSPPQRELAGRLTRAGAHWRCINSLDPLVTALYVVGIPCRATLMPGAGWVRDAA